MLLNTCTKRKCATMRYRFLVTAKAKLVSLMMCLSVSSAVVASNETPELIDISEAISQRGAVVGAFFQCHLQDGYGRKSRGRFEIGPKTGLIWHIIEPVEKKLVINASGLVESDSGARVGANKRSSQMGRLINTLTRLRPEEVSKRFDVDIVGEDDDFQLTLDPKRKLARYLTNITISGGKGLVNDIKISMKNGQSTFIAFQPEAHLPQAHLVDPEHVVEQASASQRIAHVCQN